MQVNLTTRVVPGDPERGTLIGVDLEAGLSSTFNTICSSYGDERGEGSYEVPASAALELVKLLKRYGAKVTVDHPSTQSTVLLHAPNDIGGPGKGEGLFIYQRRGAEWLRARRRALLADEMGLGKSATSLAALPLNAAALVVCPPVVVGAWYNEARRWRKDLVVRDWKQPWSMFPSKGEIVIVPYSRLPFDSVEVRGTFVCERGLVPQLRRHIEADIENEEELCDGMYKGVVSREEGTDVVGECPKCGGLTQKPKFLYSTWIGEDGPKTPFTLIPDEAHYAKTPRSRRTLTLRAIAAMAERTWLCTGTPLLNNPPELWALMQVCESGGRGAAKDVFGSWAEFVKLFGGKKKFFGGFDWSGEVLPEGTARLGTIMLRRTRQEVLPELPEKSYCVHLCGKVKVSTDVGSLFVLDEMTDDHILEECAPDGILSTHRRMLAEAKTKEMLKLVEQYEETNEPLVVFSAHRAPILALQGRKGWGVITGDVSAAERSALVADFQAGKLKGLAGTIGAMGVGVTLTYAAHMLFVDRSYVPAENLQAEDRECRIGQKRAILITTMVADHAVDRRVAEVLERKEAMLREAGLG